MSEQFKREIRYSVIKIATGRPVECVVVESDWPEYEIVWQMIQDRMEGRPNELTELRNEKAALAAQVAMQDEVLREVRGFFSARETVLSSFIPLLDSALSATAETVAAWKAENDANVLVSAANTCEQFATERFHAYGTYETDTGAAYYTGNDADEFYIRDEENNACAEALRSRATRLRATKDKEPT